MESLLVWIGSEAFGGSQTMNTGVFSTALLQVLHLILQFLMYGVHLTLLYTPTLRWIPTCGSDHISVSPATFGINATSGDLPPPSFPMLADLPPEVWRMVFGYLTTQISPINYSELSAEALWKNSTFPDPHTPRDFPILPQFMGRAIPCRLWKPEFKPSSEALIVVQVCRAWHDLGLEFLYHTVVFSTTSHFNILRATLAPPNGRGRFVRRVRIGCSVQISPDDLQPVLDYCPNIEDFEAHEMYPSRRLFPPLASRPNIRHCFFSSRDSSRLFDISPINLSPFTNLRTLHIVAVAAIEQLPAILSQLAVLVIKSSSHYYQHVAKWTLPSLRVLVCQWITTPGLHALCKAFAQTVEVLEVIQYDLWSIRPDTLEMPMLKHLVIDWIPPFPWYTPRFNLSRHFHSLPSLTAVHINNLDRALQHTRVVTVAAELEEEIAMLGPESPLAPQLQALYVGARIEDIAWAVLERCFATTAAVGWVLRGRDGIWKVTGDGQLILAEPVAA